MNDILEQNIEFMLLTPSEASLGKKYFININGESISYLQDRIDLKNYFETKFTKYKPIHKALEEFRNILVDFEDESIEILTAKQVKDVKNNKKLTENEIKKLNYDATTPANVPKGFHNSNKFLDRLAGSLLTKSDALWKNLDRVYHK